MNKPDTKGCKLGHRDSDCWVTLTVRNRPNTETYTEPHLCKFTPPWNNKRALWLSCLLPTMWMSIQLSYDLKNSITKESILNIFLCVCVSRLIIQHPSLCRDSLMQNECSSMHDGEDFRFCGPHIAGNRLWLWYQTEEGVVFSESFPWGHMLSEEEMMGRSR